ncbi:DgyrCDS9706 [Dimorphilus gyrociliatus]|uniref:DgyrCDS9706 n=1 Tax=Dimorphilus gyrociliatus TaxID=2664684 RepID=A0A7I8VZE7_9ANNE|nr:DgyrCDS9706 [Dimorphilus gyrociliatus]
MTGKKLTKEETIRLRNEFIGKSCPLFYKSNPLKIVEAKGQYMYDEEGQEYLDCANNVCHVGHCHPKVVAAGVEQMEILNTNSRYLNDNILHLSESLLKKFPPSLNRIYFTNSGSEANDLAMRLAKTYTGNQDIICLNAAYHGITEATMKVSPYKQLYSKPDHVHVAPNPDTYRGKFTRDEFESDKELSKLYALEIEKILNRLKECNRKIACFIHESLQSCAGQIIMPKGYLESVYKQVREHGGVCIADEVQVGFGRVGKYWWGFEMNDVVPDIVTLGKPMGNGHPISAVVTTREIADQFFEKADSFFSTFAGNPVSCRIALAVLQTIEEENLRENAIEVGHYFVNEVKKLKLKHSIIGDIRGAGLFAGIELSKDRLTKKPATEEAAFIVDSLRNRNIIMTIDGLDENVLKFKPPMCITKSNVDFLMSRLDSVLLECRFSKNTVKRQLSTECDENVPDKKQKA